MYQEHYQLVVSGKPLQGMSAAQVAGNLVNGFKFNKAQIQQVLGGKPKIIKTSPDLNAIKSLREKFISAGLNCQIKVAMNEECFRSALVFPANNNYANQKTSNLKLAPENDEVRTTLSFRAYDFNPKLFSKSANEIVNDENGNARFELHRGKIYIGWLLLIPFFAIVSYGTSTGIGRAMVSAIDNNVLVSLITMITFFSVWIFGALYSRPTSIIDIIDINRAQETFVLQQTKKLFFRNKEFFLATDMESLNASISYDQVHDQCFCESIDGFTVYQSRLQENANDTIFNVAAVLVDYLKDIPAHLFSSQNKSIGKQYQVFDQENRLIGSFSIGSEIIVKTDRQDSNTAYLLSMALITAGV